MMADTEPGISLLCTDTRESILENLTGRFSRAGINNYKTMVLDLASGRMPKPEPVVDGIVADVPCTGSGTWARTPEWLTFFKPASIEIYRETQRKIISGILKLLQIGRAHV